MGTTQVPKQLSIKGNLLIDGNITQNGSAYETHAQQVYTTDDKIIMRDGATAGLIAGATSGLTFKKYDGTNDGELSVDSSGTARVGDVGDLQPLATRNEAGLMTNNQPVVWDSSGLKMVTRELVAGDIPGLDAGKITTGAFADARIPNLNASKVTAGTFADARIPTSVERTANKRTTFQTTPSDTAYPSEKLVKDSLDEKYSASNAPPYPVTSVAGKTGAVTLAKGDVGLGNADNTSDLTVLGMVYPVGTIHTSVNSANPSTYFGFGTWVAFGSGQVLVGVDTSQTEFNVVKKTGGSKTHTLTTAEMPSHTHGSKELKGEINPELQTDWSARMVGATGIFSAIGTKTTKYLNFSTEYSAPYGLKVNASHEHNSVGSGGSHNNLQPYITVYMWERTA